MVSAKDTQRMSTLRRPLLFFSVSLLSLFLGCTFATHAQSPLDPFPPTYLLVAKSSPGFVELSGVRVTTQISCRGKQCQLQIVQVYDLVNRDQVKPAEVRLAIEQTTLSSDEILSTKDITLTISPNGESPDISQTWTGHWRQQERKRITLTHTLDLPDQSILAWQWDMRPLASWSTVTSARITWLLPFLMTDDAFLLRSPYPTGFDGHTLWWEYERPSELPEIRIVMIHPLVWKALRDAEKRGDDSAISEYYVNILNETGRLGIAVEDGYLRALAALQATIAKSPSSKEARLQLADLYLERASASDQQNSLHYLTLAAEQLQAILYMAPSDIETAQKLANIYMRAARLCSDLNDPGAALDYLHQAAALQGATALSDGELLETLRLRWALDLARQGRIQEALTELDEILPPASRDALLRYAPPIASARVAITTSTHLRQARYTLGLYGPTATDTLAHLQELLSQLDALPCCQAHLEVTPPTEGSPLSTSQAIFTVIVPYENARQLRESADTIHNVLSAEPNLLETLIASPWGKQVRPLEVIETWLTQEYRYAEQVDLEQTAKSWYEFSEFARWRLAELTQLPSPQDDEQQRTERTLAILALQDQCQVWDSIPAATYWVYGVELPNKQEEGPSRWIVGWNEQRELRIVRRDIKWRSAGLAICALSTVLLLLSLAIHIARSKHRAISRGR